MIDTIRVRYRISPYPPTRYKISKKKTSGKPIVRNRFENVNELEDIIRPFEQDPDKMDLRVNISSETYRKPPKVLVEVSLPKVLYGTNSKLICTQQEIDKAFEIIELVLRQKGILIQGRPDFQRVDLVWHFMRPPLPFLLAHFTTTNRAMRGKVHLYRDRLRFTGVRWKASQMIINMYDKIAEKEAKRGWFRIEGRFKPRYLRVEVQIQHPDKLKTLFRRKIRKLRLLQCYSVYRKVLLDFSGPNPELLLAPADEKADPTATKEKADPIAIVDFQKELPPASLPPCRPSWLGDFKAV